MSPSAAFDPIAIMQATEDFTWQRNKETYLVLSANWIAENKQLRDMDKPLTPKPVMPLHKIFRRDSSGLFDLVQDPNLHEPVLPTAPPTISSPPITTGQTTADMAAPYILQMLSQIWAKLNEKAG